MDAPEGCASQTPLIILCSRTTGPRAPVTRQVASDLSPLADSSSHNSLAAGLSWIIRFRRSRSNAKTTFCPFMSAGQPSLSKSLGDHFLRNKRRAIKPGSAVSSNSLRWSAQKALCRALFPSRRRARLSAGRGSSGSFPTPNAKTVLSHKKNGGGAVPERVNDAGTTSRLDRGGLLFWPLRSIGSAAGVPSSFNEIRKPMFSIEDPNGGGLSSPS